MNHLLVVSVIAFSIISAPLAVGDLFHIVTSPASPCPGEVIGEPCLTLQQYISNPSQSANVTLMLESGIHWLLTFDSLLKLLNKDVEHFTMVSDGAQVTYSKQGSSNYYYKEYYSLKLQLIGIIFVSTTDEYTAISIRRAQELLIENCSFQGINIYLYDIRNVLVLRSCFSNGYEAIRSYSLDSVVVSECIFSNNTSTNQGGAISVNIIPSGRSIIINSTTFINNTSLYKGGAVFLSKVRGSVIINASIFINNSVSEGTGGAVYLDENSRNNEIIITKSTFIYNTANSSDCGAISIANFINVNLTGSDFYYNRATNDGGAVCVRGSNISISNCSFTQNTALGVSGALLTDNSTVLIQHTIFRDNTAGYDGGALSVYAYPCNYMIFQSSFIDNHAGDDGGAVYVGRAGSYLKIEQCTLSNNRAADRGGAIAIYGSTMDMKATNVYNNAASLGKSISACNSEFVTSLSHSQRDNNCTNYDTNIKDIFVPVAEERDFPNIIHFSKDAPCVRLAKEKDTILNELGTTSAISYTALTFSITPLIGLLLYIIITKAVQRIILQRASLRPVGKPLTQNESEPVYEEAQLRTAEGDVSDIEMKPNVVYGEPHQGSMTSSSP